MEKKSNWAIYKAVLDKNNIKKLYHFTDRANLASIIQRGGLYSWGDCQEKGIKINKPGGGGPGSLSWSIDKKRGLNKYVRVCFTRNHPMMYVALNDGRIKDSIILEIDPEVIFWEGTLYSDKNATKHDANIGETIGDFNKIHFSSVLKINHFVLLPEEQPYFQAEILVKNFIPIKYITNIADFDKSLSKQKQKIFSKVEKTIYSPEETISNLWNSGRMDDAILMAGNGYIPQKDSQVFIERYLDSCRFKSNYQYELNINKRFFKYTRANGSYLSIIANKGMYDVTVYYNNYFASFTYSENDLEKILKQKEFPSKLINEIGFLCQKNYEERMAMGVMIQVIAYSDAITERFENAVKVIMNEHLYLPDDYDYQICFFTPKQIDAIMNDLSIEKKRFLFILMSKLLLIPVEDNKSGTIVNVITSKRFRVSTKIVNMYNLPIK